MEVLLAEYLGFCYGVKRAINLARSSASPAGNSFTLGPIIHNPQMVERLEHEGVGMVNTLDEMDGGTIIIRSHGVGPQVYEEATAAGLQLVDATCPHVKKAQMAAHTLAESGYVVVIVGEKKHPEVRSIFEWSGHKAIVVETEEEAGAITACGKLGIVAQTTFSGDEFKKIVMILLDKSNDLRIVRTICTATDQRQAAAIELAKSVDVMLVIGGKNSANTTRLAQLCAKKCKTYHIETVVELQNQWFDKIEKIGITAGASTPDWIIKEVYKKCKTWKAYYKKNQFRK
jgi:4-hydroxy-3-methylbut-2-en-1-yl diphosphate reductase